jgi:ribosomal protein L25 (general stress protein Ctc)
MAQQANLQAATRPSTGKGAARTLRREGKVPGVIYGHNRSPEALAIEATALKKMLIGVSAGTTVFDVVVDGRPAVKALIRFGPPKSCIWTSTRCGPTRRSPSPFRYT